MIMKKGIWRVFWIFILFSVSGCMKVRRVDESVTEKNIIETSVECYLIGRELDNGYEVMVPINGVERIENETLIVQKDGITIYITKGQAISEEGVTYSVYERLRMIVKECYEEYEQKYYEVAIGDIEDLSVDSARTEGTYIVEEDELRICEETWYIKRVDEKSDLLIRVVVEHDKITNDTERIVKELEEYYGVDFRFESDAANEKLEEYIEWLNIPTKSIELGEVTIEIPESWEIDYKMNSSIYTVYAPMGKTASMGCALIVGVEEEDEQITHEQRVADYQKSIENNGTEYTIYENAGETFIGETILVKYQIITSRQNNEYCGYYGFMNGKKYTILMSAEPQCVEYAFDVLKRIMRKK